MLNVAKMLPLPTTTAVPVNPATKGSRQKKRVMLAVRGGVGGGGHRSQPDRKQM